MISYRRLQLLKVFAHAGGNLAPYIPARREQLRQRVLHGSPYREIRVGDQFEPFDGFGPQWRGATDHDPPEFHLRQPRDLRQTAQAECQRPVDMHEGWNAFGVGPERIVREDLI